MRTLARVDPAANAASGTRCKVQRVRRWGDDEPSPPQRPIQPHTRPLFFWNSAFLCDGLHIHMGPNLITSGKETLEEQIKLPTKQKCVWMEAIMMVIGAVTEW
jgi:hypothetical protein